MDIPLTKILGIRIDLVDLNSTLQIVEKFIQSRTPHQIVVVNVAKIIKAQTNKLLKHIINNADLVGADGVPVVWISKLFKPEIPGRVNGTDLMEKLVQLSAEKGYSIFFFGAEENVVKTVIKKYKEKYPSLNVAGYRNGYFTTEEEQEIVERIQKSKADILLVGFGTPQKEYFVYKYKYELKVPVIHGVGGSFDVVAGKTKRAPLWMQKYGLEWFFRILQEPRRMWKRYLVTNTLFVVFILLELLGLKNFEQDDENNV